MNFPLCLIDKMDKNYFVQIPTLLVSNVNYPKFYQPGLIPITHDIESNKIEYHDTIINEELTTKDEDNEISDKDKQKLDKNFDDQTKAVDALKQEKDEQRKLEKTAQQGAKGGEIVSKDKFNSYSDDDEVTVFNVSNNGIGDNIRGNLSGPRTRRSRCGGKRRIAKKQIFNSLLSLIIFIPILK